MSPWNGRTQLQRAAEELARLAWRYPGDAFELVTRPDPASPWERVARIDPEP
jgi:hypothetical protein